MPNPLYDIPGLGGYLASQDRRRAMGQQDMEGNLQQIKLADLLNAREQETKDKQQLQSIMSQTGGDPSKAIQALLTQGTPKSIELASKLKGLVPQQPKPDYSSKAKELIDSGYQYGTPEFNAAMRNSGIEKAPTSRTILSGTQKITQEWRDGKWHNVAVGSEKTPAQLYKEEQDLRKQNEAAEKRELAKQQSIGKADLVIGKVDDALKKVGFFTTGLTGAALSMVPGTKSYDLDKTVDTIKANIGFKELADMRAASPTGGALGQIAVRELDFLQAAIASLATGLSEEEKRKSLEQIKTHYTNWRNATTGNEAQPQPSPQANPQSPKRIKFDAQGNMVQ